MFNAIFQSLGEYIGAGGWVMPPLVLATVVLWFALGYRFAALKKGTVRNVRNLVRRSESGKMPHGNGVLVRALKKGLELKRAGQPYLRARLDDAFFDEEREIRKYHVLIMTIVLSAPLLGLLGTVIGMIETFDSLADMSLFSQSGGIAGGISQALITTQMGLAVAIPGLIVNGILFRTQKNMEMELAQLKDILCSEPLSQEPDGSQTPQTAGV
jgi:biopolymer transport protein ExbB